MEHRHQNHHRRSHRRRQRARHTKLHLREMTFRPPPSEGRNPDFETCRLDRRGSNPAEGLPLGF